MGTPSSTDSQPHTINDLLNNAIKQFDTYPDNWSYTRLYMLQAQIALLNAVLEQHAHEMDEQQKVERELLLTSLKIRQIKAIKIAKPPGATNFVRDAISLKAQREREMAFQQGGNLFAALYGFGQGAYCAGFTVMLIGLNYFMNNALVAALGWPSLLLLVVALPIFLTTLSNYWIMRKDMGIMAMQAHDRLYKDKHGEPKAAEKLSAHYAWAILTAVLGGILCSTLTAYGIYQLLPGAPAVALAVSFFMITIVPELVLGVNHNKKFWSAPIKNMKNAYASLGENKYKARFIFWVFASCVGMVFTALALTSLANIAGIPFYISFPMLSAITLSNVSFYFNRAFEHVMRQKQNDALPPEQAQEKKQLSTSFSFIRVSNAFSNAIVAVIGFLATASSAGLITVHGSADLALANMASLLNFSAPAVIACLCAAIAVGVLAGATSYIANSAGVQEGYESVIAEDLALLNELLPDEQARPARNTTPEAKSPRVISYWYEKTDEDRERYKKDTEAMVFRPTPA